MKKNKLNKKFIIILLIVIILLAFIIGFGIIRKKGSSSPTQQVKSYLNKYKREDKEVTSVIQYNFSDKLNAEQEKRYKEIIKKQYRNLNYVIEDTYESEIESNISIKFTVLDLKSEYERATTYIATHEDKFTNENGELDNDKVISYKLEQLENTVESVEYTITIKFYKNKDNEWVMTNPSKTDLSKLDGTF